MIFFPRYDQEIYRRRLVANMPRARDETLPADLWLQTIAENLSTANTQGQTMDTGMDEDGKKATEASEPKDIAKDKKAEKKEKLPAPKPEKQKGKPAAEKKPSKDAQKKGDKKPKDSKVKEMNEKKK